MRGVGCIGKGRNAGMIVREEFMLSTGESRELGVGVVVPVKLK